MSEIWIPIKNYEELYEVSNLGRVRSKGRCIMLPKAIHHIKPKILKGGLFSNGYKFVCLRKNGINKNHLVHRLVAEAFIENPNNYPVVNHIDGNKLNNKLTNLEWCTYSYNLEHAIKIGLVESQCKIRRSVIVERDEKIVTFKTMSDCAKFFGFKKGWLGNRIRKHGLTFEYDGYTIHVNGREKW